MPGCPLVFANSVLLLFVSSQLCWTAGILTRKHHKFSALVRIRRLRLRPTSKSVNHKSPCRENPSVREILNAKGPGAGRRVKVEAEGIPRNDLDATTGDLSWKLDSRGHYEFQAINARFSHAKRSGQSAGRNHRPPTCPKHTSGHHED